MSCALLAGAYAVGMAHRVRTCPQCGYQVAWSSDTAACASCGYSFDYQVYQGVMRYILVFCLLPLAFVVLAGPALLVVFLLRVLL